MADRKALPAIPEGFSLQAEAEAELPPIPKGFSLDPPRRGNPEAEVSTALHSLPQPFKSLGTLYDVLPSFRDPAPVKMLDRAKTNFSTSDPLERAKALRDLGYKDVAVGDKGVTVEGKRLDSPAFTPSLSELSSELVENVDMAPGALIFTNPVSAILGTAAMAGGREAARQEMVPDADLDLTTGAVETAVSAIPLAGKAISPLFKSLGGFVKSGAKTATGKATKAGKELYESKGKEIWQSLDGIKKRTVERLDDMFGSSATLKQLGITDDKFNVFNLKPIKENYAYLVKESPEFAEIASMSGAGVRARRVADLYDQVGTRIRSFYDTSDATIPVSDIFDTESYKGLREGIFAVTNSDEAVEQLMKQHDEMIEGVWLSVAADKLLKDPNTEAAAADAGIGVMEYVRGKVASLKGVDSKEIIEALSTEQVPIGYAWELRKHFDEWAAYKLAQKGADDIPESLLLYRGMAGMFRDAIEKSLPEGSQMAKDIKLFHNLVPIAQDMAVKASKDVGTIFRPNDFYVSAIGGNLYRGLGYASKIARNPSARAGIAGAFDSVKELVPEGINAARGAVSPTANPYIRGLQTTAIGREVGDNVFNPDDTSLQSGPIDPNAPAPLALEDFSALFGQTQPTPISRDPEQIGSSPDDIAFIQTAVSPRTFAIFQDALRSDDPMKKRAATVMVMSEAPEIFEPGMYGLRSVIADNDRYVIGDYQEAVNYRATLKSLLNRGSISRNFYAKQLSALNDPTDMQLFPRPDVTSTERTSEFKVKPKSNLEKLQDTTKKISTPVGERNEQPY